MGGSNREEDGLKSIIKGKEWECGKGDKNGETVRTWERGWWKIWGRPWVPEIGKYNIHTMGCRLPMWS